MSELPGKLKNGTEQSVNDSVNDVANSSEFYVGEWRVDVPANRLHRGAEEIKLEARVMDVLVFFASRPGELITREVLEKEVWEGRVVSYESLTSSINKLRKAFGDSARNPRYIETVSKKGYRLIASVSNHPPDVKPSKASKPTITKYWIAIVAMVVITLILVFVFINKDADINQDGIDQQKRVETQSLTVLPFVDISSDSSRRYLGDGITEDLTTALSKISGLFVIARSSAMLFKDRATDVKEIARKLGVSYVVEGSVQREKNNLRIHVKLIDGESGFNLWAQQYDREVTDIFAVQDNITEKIVDALSVKLTEEERKRTARKYTISFDAYDTFLQGQVHYVKHTKEENLKARELYQQSIELDPQFARAYSATALTYSAEYRYGWSSDPQLSLREAEQLANKAVALDDQLPHAYWVLGYVYLQQRMYDRAIVTAKRATALNPNFADGFATLGVIYIYSGDPRNGMLMMQRAIRLSPQFPAPYASALGQAYYFLGRYEEALPVLRQAMDRNVNLLTSHVFYIASLSKLDRKDEANWAAIQLKALNPDFSLGAIGEMFPIKGEQNLEKFKQDLREAGLQ